MLRFLYHLVLLFFVIFPHISWAHSPYSEFLYEYSNGMGERLVVERFYVDGIILNDPSKFRVKNNSTVLYETDRYVHDIAVVKITNGRYFIFEFDSFFSPFADRILVFDGEKFSENHSTLIFISSPIARLLDHKIDYLLFILFILGAFFSGKFVINKNINSWIRIVVLIVTSPVIFLLGPIYVLTFPFMSSLNPLLVVLSSLIIYVMFKTIRLYLKKSIFDILFNYIFPIWFFYFSCVYITKLINFTMQLINYTKII